jgi:hypothetical protein
MRCIRYMTGPPEASAELVDLGAHSVTQTSAHADERALPTGVSMHLQVAQVGVLLGAAAASPIHRCLAGKILQNGRCKSASLRTSGERMPLVLYDALEEIV